MSIKEKMMKDLNKKWCSNIELEIKYHSSSVSRRLREMRNYLTFKWKEIKKDGKVICRYKVWKVA